MSPRIGYNHNIAYRGRPFHVQTEDSGRSKGHIYTHVFFDGVVVASNKLEYGRGGTDEPSSEDLVQLVQGAHRAMIRQLCTGALDERLQRLLDPHEPSPVTAARPEDQPLDCSMSHIERIRHLKETIDMSNVMNSLNRINDEISGILGTALVDHESGMCLGTVGTGINLEVAAAGNMEVVRAKLRVMDALGIAGGIEDILITLQDQYHIIRPVGDSLFLYLAIDRKRGNLALARHKMASIGAEVVV